MSNTAELTNLLNQRSFDWALKAFSPSEEAGAHFARKLADLRAFMANRGIGESAPSLNSLRGMVDSSPFKLDAFLVALISLKTPQMIAAAWRMIQGMQVDSLEMKFEYASSFSMSVSLKSPYGEMETYATEDIEDMTFVRHLMKSKSGDLPIINGFFSLRRPQ